MLNSSKKSKIRKKEINIHTYVTLIHAHAYSCTYTHAHFWVKSTHTCTHPQTHRHTHTRILQTHPPTQSVAHVLMTHTDDGPKCLVEGGLGELSVQKSDCPRIEGASVSLLRGQEIEEAIAWVGWVRQDLIGPV